MADDDTTEGATPQETAPPAKHVVYCGGRIRLGHSSGDRN